MFEFYPVTPLFKVCPSVFVVPPNYHRRGGSRHTPMSNNDEEVLQYAIHQSLLESHRVPGQVRTHLSTFSAVLDFVVDHITEMPLPLCVYLGGKLE